MDNYNPFIKTAIVRKGTSKPMRILREKGLLKGKILDYGCGHGEDTNILKMDYGINIVGYDKFNDTYNSEELLNKKYDIATCNYVLNVIPDLDEHKDVIELLRQLSDNVYICVRSDIKAIRENWVYNEQQLGYWTTNNSFQRFYNADMIEKLFGEVEYISNNSSFKLFKIKIN